MSLFLTGATGFLGHYLLAELLRRPNLRCRVLLRPPLADSTRRLATLLDGLGVSLSAHIDSNRIIPVEGALPDGLSVDSLIGVSMVIHSAGSTLFDSDSTGEPSHTNVAGTQALLASARAAGVTRFVQISTAYVCGDRVGVIPETVAADPPPFRNDYERSKWRAEQLVRAWSDATHSAVICRPSILFGDRSNGRATTMKGLYLIARATELLGRAVADDPDLDRQHIPLRLYGKRDATSNVVPVDWAAEQIVRIALDSSSGPVHHITNPDAPSHAEIKAWLEGYFDIGGGRFCDAPWPLENPNHYESLFYSLGNVVHDYFRHGLSFESHCSDGAPEDGRLVDRDHFFACLRYAQSTQWGRGGVEARRPQQPAGRIDPRWYFEKYLPFAVPRSVVARVEALTAIIRFVITDLESCDWVCRFEQGQLAAVHGLSGGPTAEFEYRLSYDEFESIVAARRSVQEVFFQGHVEILGNVERALKMVPIVGEFLREFPVC
ncbi:MAG: SDR family oxidoreductase [Phycisphaerae bacterium]